jgi:hypothetical protein
MGPWILPSDQRVQTSLAEGKSLPEAWAQIPEKLAFMTILEITQLKVDYSRTVLRPWRWVLH